MSGTSSTVEEVMAIMTGSFTTSKLLPFPLEHSDDS
jgi:hypothetical protein